MKICFKIQFTIPTYFLVPTNFDISYIYFCWLSDQNELFYNRILVIVTTKSKLTNASAITESSIRSGKATRSSGQQFNCQHQSATSPFLSISLLLQLFLTAYYLNKLWSGLANLYSSFHNFDGYNLRTVELYRYAGKET